MFKRLITSHTFRRRTSWMVAIVLIVPFILFFHATSQPPIKGPGGIAGIVFGKEVPWELFQEQRSWLLRQLDAQGGTLHDTAAATLDQQAWDRIMMLEEARRRGIRVTNEALVAHLHALGEFKRGQQFSSERYHQILTASGTTAQRFEQEQRHALLIQQLLDTITAEVVVTDEEVTTAARTVHEALTATVILIDPLTFVDAVSATLTEETLHAFYAAHPEEVRIPDQLQIEYAEQSAEELATQVSVTEAQLREFYDDHPTAFTDATGTPQPFEEVQDQVRRQLMDRRVRAALTSVGLDLTEELEDGRSFEEIVTRRALTLQQTELFPAGELLIPGGPHPALLRAVQGLTAGQVSEVVTTDTAVYLARLLKRVPSRIPPFEEVRDQVKAQLTQDRARETAQASAAALRVRLIEQQASGAAFEDALAAEGYAATTSHFTRAQPIPPIGTFPPLNDAAFATPLGTLTEVMETPAGFVLLRPDARMPADDATVTAAAPTIRSGLLSQRQRDHREAWLADLRRRAQRESFLDDPEQPQHD